MSLSTTRPVLGEISGNITRGKELTPKLRGQVISMAECGHNVPYIMARFKLSRKAVRYTLDNDELRTNANSLPRPGATKSFTALDERNIVRHARYKPKDIYAKLKEATGVTCSYKTIARVL
jgi:hypothetical protein